MVEQKISWLNTRYAIVQASYWMSFAVVFAFGSVFLLSRGFDNRQIGVIMAMGNVLAAICQSPVASFADRSEKVSLSMISAVTGGGIIGASILLMMLSGQKGLSGLLFLLAATMVLILQPLVNAVGMFFVNKGYSVNFGLARGIGSASYALMASLLGFLVEDFGEKVILYALLAVYVVYVISICFMDTRKDSHRTEVKLKEKEETSSSLKEFVLTYRKFMLMLVGVALLFANHNILNTYMFQIMQSVGGGSQDMGISMALAAISELPAMFLFSWLIIRFRCRSLLQLSAVFFSVKSVLFVFAGSVGMIHGAQLAQALAFALFTPASVYYVNQNIARKDHVKGQALSTTANTVGGVIGSLVGGQLLAGVGAKWMLIVGAMLSIAGTVIVCFFAEEAPGTRSKQ